MDEAGHSKANDPAARAALDDAEQWRLAELHSLRMLGTGPEDRFDELARLATMICETPMALISLVDAERQWLKASVGLELREVPRTLSFCTHAVSQGKLLVVPDAREDPRFAQNPLVVREPQLRFYAGVPLLSRAGAAYGALCVLDRVPRELSPKKLEALSILSRQVVAQLEWTRVDRLWQEAATALDDRESELKAIMRLAHLGTTEWNVQSGAVHFHGDWTSLGYADHELPDTAEGWEALLHPDDRAKKSHAIDAHLAGQSPYYQVEHRRRAKDGSYQWALTHGATIKRDEAGAPLVVQGIHIDIHRQKQLEHELSQASRLASIGTLAAGVAHEINNPLTYLLGNLSVVRRVLEGLGASRAPDSQIMLALEALSDATHGAQRVRDVVKDLHSLTRPADESMLPIELIGVLESAINVARHEIRHRARLVRRYEHRPVLNANAGRLNQLLVNLLVNAAQAIPEGDAEGNQVTVRLREENEQTLIAVSDTGRGIHPDHLPHIFDPFFTTKGESSGTGLGLSICRRIVEEHGGSIRALSQPGEGTTIEVRLPDRGADDTPAQPPTWSEVTGSLEPRYRILVVDDEPAVVRIVRRFLSAQHDVYVDESGPSALTRIVGGESFDVILCDLMMPTMTGQAFYAELEKAAPEHADRVVFMTGGTRAKEAREWSRDNRRRLIEKPFSSATLSKAIVACVTRARGPIGARAKVERGAP